MNTKEINDKLYKVINEIYINKAYKDGKINNEEIQNIRDIADLVFEKLVIEAANTDKNNSITAFQKSCDVTVQLMQDSFLKLKKENLNSSQKDLIKTAFNAQLTYIKANFDRFFNSL